MLENPLGKTEGAFVMAALAREWMRRAQPHLSEREGMAALRALARGGKERESLDIPSLREKGAGTEATEQPDGVRWKDHQRRRHRHDQKEGPHGASDAPTAASGTDRDLGRRGLEPEQGGFGHRRKRRVGRIRHRVTPGRRRPSGAHSPRGGSRSACRTRSARESARETDPRRSCLRAPVRRRPLPPAAARTSSSPRR